MCNSMLLPYTTHSHTHTDSKELNASELETNTYAQVNNTTEIATTENVAYITAGDVIPATQNAAYGQVPPGTDDCYDYVIN